MMSLSQVFLDFLKKFTSSFSNLGQKIQTLLQNPISLITVLGLLVILIVLIKSKNIKFDSKMISRIGLALALSTILDMIKIYHFPQGGSITLGAMIPIFLIAFMYGPLIGFLTGFLFGFISLLTDPFILNPVQVLFDYPLPYLFLGIAGFFKNKYIIGATLGMFLKFLCHFISGIVFFGSYVPANLSPWIYSLTTNGILVGTNAIICILILSLLPIKQIIKVPCRN